VKFASPFDKGRGTKVRDLGRFALRAQTILLAAHCRVLRGLDGSKIGRLQFLYSRGTSLAFDLASAHHGSYVHRHPVRSRASQSDSRNRVCKDQSGVAGGIYSPRSCGFANVAKEFAHTQFLFCEVSGRGSQRIHLIERVLFEELKLIGELQASPLTSILSPGGGRRITSCIGAAPSRRAGFGRAYLFILQTRAGFG
jgi:hypothetical protein